MKMAVDADRRPGAYWLTGSQQFSVMRGISESLAGRVGIVQLLGFSAREAGRRDLKLPPFLPTAENLSECGKTASGELAAVYQQILRGSFPALCTGAIRDRDLFYSSYVQTYLQRDVRNRPEIGDEAAFLRFLQARPRPDGEMLNLSELARDVDIRIATAKR